MFPKTVIRGQATEEDLKAPAGYLAGEAEGAYPIGTRILKVDRDPTDVTPIGTKGYVLASHDVSDADVPDVKKAIYFYFVKWDDFPHPVGVVDWKIGKEGVL